MSLETLLAGLLSHGFREDCDSPYTQFRRFQKQGREDRWLHRQSLRLFIGNSNPGDWLKCGSLEEPCSQIELLLKCGKIWLRTREREEYRKRPRQEVLRLDADELLKEIG